MKSTIIYVQDKEIEYVMNSLMYDLDIVLFFRYSYVSKIPKNLSWYEEIFPQYDEKRFRELVRCNPTQFETMLNQISSQPVFNGVNSHKQFTVAFNWLLCCTD